MKRPLEGRLAVLADALGVAHRRCGEAAAVAEERDAELHQQLLDFSYTIDGLRRALDESMAEIDDFNHTQALQGNPAGAPGDYPQGPNAAGGGK